MRGPDPAEYGWWLASRAAGIVALLCVTVSVALGLAMAGRVSARPGLARTLLAVHRQTALAGLVAIAVHGITLLGDRFLDPGLAGIAVPFVIDHAPLWTGLGVTAGWLAARARAELLDPGPDRARALARAAPGDDPRLRARGRPRARRRDGRAKRRGCARCCSSRALPCSSCSSSASCPCPRADRPSAASASPRSRPRAPTSRRSAWSRVDGKPLAPAAPGQFVTVRVDVPGLGRRVRSYSLSGGAADQRQARGRGQRVTCTRRRSATWWSSAGPSGSFHAGRGGRPAGRPAQRRRRGDAGARDAPAARRAALGACGLVGARRPLRTRPRVPRGGPRARRPAPARPRSTSATAGRARATGSVAITRPPAGSPRRTCSRSACRWTPPSISAGRARSSTRWRAVSQAAGVPAERIRSERFGAAPAAPAARRPPPSRSRARASRPPGTGATAACSSWPRRTTWRSTPAAGSGACHGCRTGVLEGDVRHDPEPLDPPPPGSALLCCARPHGDVVLDA